MLLVGYDEGVGPSFYFLDYLASMQKLDYGSHGYGGFFCNRCDLRSTRNPSPTSALPDWPVPCPSQSASRPVLPLKACWTRIGVRI